ncbi:hypothetical protein [Actinomadura verrucosospora]|uniref:Uncharacterized protein n=1 Tax=Actinomadura verrucosospora TaxID=46165 RepID=A0A7D3W0M2_ACTVE|nr:hypothetical protein [Actinomadura verrucosospora]QKG23351.1 hypothetical protein ACTIVE_4994 [Actinomadura verrucosospora]
MDRHLNRPGNRLLVIVVAALLGIGLVAALLLLRDGGQGSTSHGPGRGTAVTETGGTFKATVNGHYGMLDWTVQNGRIQGCYTEVTTSDYSGGRVADAEPFGGWEDSDGVHLTGLLHDRGPVTGTLHGGTLTVDGTWGPVSAYSWHSTSPAEFWRQAPGGDSGPKPTC